MAGAIAANGCVGGATGACVFGNGLTARATADGWEIDGKSDPTLGLPGAQRILVRAHAPDAAL